MRLPRGSLLSAILSEAAAGCGASVIYLPGNHDDREAFRRHLLGDAGVPGTPLNQVHWRDGLRVVALDSTIPGEDGGRLDPARSGKLPIIVDQRGKTGNR